MIYTSYFGKVKNINPEFLFAVTASKPKFFNGKHLNCVAPNYKWVDDYKQGRITELQYTDLYIKYLNNNKENIISQIKSLPDNSMLLCYEVNGKFCHRHILANWLRQNGILIEEYGFNELDKEVLF